MKLEYKEGLLFTSIGISYKGRSKIINNVVVDTGASGSIISPDAVDDIGIYAELNDKIMEYYGVGGSTHNAFVKNIEEIKIGNESINGIQIDFGLIDQSGKINGLIGLDVLIEIGAVIDLGNFS
ncbi:retropepsin-like aspartic protease [Clostridium sp. JN-9]|uniref:retropepsin-like aspartic protease n=1 Tax=Clostridium sp. JN-9 TaxID=2507159 RepID=UPI000FFE24FA|nr:retropepsin-like aspartic protease [Clostridium sp. JN-9]QAT39853.1 aspartyl protease [Clostridium sp. JN-9]